MRNPASPRTARLINDRAAYELLLTRGPLTRAQLRDLTGLSGPTVAELVARLETVGLVAPVGTHEQRRRGPNAQLYGAVPGAGFAVGIDVTAERVSAAAVDLTGAVVGTGRVPLTRRAVPHEVVLAAARSALPADLQRLAAVVIGMPGLVDPATGDVGYAANLPGWSANLIGGLRERLPRAEVVLENEVNLAGVAEQRLGAAAGHDSFALLSLGDGIGVAVVLGGRLHRGASGGAGEAGYLPLGTGVFHEAAGGEALVRLAGEYGETGALADIVAAADRELLEAIADRIATGAVAICVLLDPGLLVLGGEVGRAGGATLAELVQSRLTERVPQRIAVTAATAPGNPVLQGAHLLGLDIARRAALADRPATSER